MNIIDPTARISALADLETSSRGSSIRVGARAMIDAFVKIKFAGGAGDVEIGPDCYLNSGCVLYSGHGIVLHSNVLVAANCTFAATNHAFADRDRLIRQQGFMPSRGGIIVEDDVWIGANCVLLDGAYIGRGAVISAGSVVNGEVAPFAIMAGAIARPIGERGR
jgi:virginiamycin A acetyltransferase